MFLSDDLPNCDVDHPSSSGNAPVVSSTKQITDPGSSNPAPKRSVVDDNKTSLPSLASSGAKFILRGVRESADAFGPLKSAAGGLCYILDNCDVRLSSYPPLKVFTVAPANESE